MALPTQAELNELFDYNPETGIVVRKKITGRSTKIGQIVGVYNSHGYKVVRIGKRGQDKLIGLHRVIWCLVYGQYPKRVIDHINRDRTDNRLCNLREVTVADNIKNHKLYSNNKSGISGVCWDSKKELWMAFVSVRSNGNRKHSILIKSDMFDEVVCHRLAAEQCLGYTNLDRSTLAMQYVKKNIQGLTL